MSLALELERLIATAVREALAAERPRLVAEIKKELERESKEPAWWSPTDARRHAKCSSAAVFSALSTGDLPAEVDEDSRRSRPGIPGRRWRIKPSDAKAWAERRRAGAA